MMHYRGRESYQQFLTAQSLELLSDAVESLAMRKHLGSPTLTDVLRQIERKAEVTVAQASTAA